MNTALSWIKAYVPELECTNQEYTDAMTLSGTKVETYEALDKNLDKIYVGQILSIEKHPDADKLIVCQVDLGDKQLQIVTGAPNVKVGDKVPVKVIEIDDQGRINLTMKDLVEQKEEEVEEVSEEVVASEEE